MTVLVDNGHGADTPGKRSPDGRLREYEWARDTAALVTWGLRGYGIDARLLVPEREDIPVNARARRANAVCRERGRDGVLLVSVHVNAAGDGKRWRDASGWQACVSLNASEASKRLAARIRDRIRAGGMKTRERSAGEAWWPMNIGICRDTLCPAVLTENFFMDNRGDCDFLLSGRGRAAIAEAHVCGIMDFIGLEP